MEQKKNGCKLLIKICDIMVDWWYYNNLFGVEDGLFYENNKRLGYYQDEKEDEILRNNHKATVDRMLELKELNIEFKRIRNKLKNENNDLKQMVDFYKSFQKDARELEKENERLKSDNFNLNKTVEYLDETVKEQCNKIAWADECGVRWNEEYHEWMGDME